MRQQTVTKGMVLTRTNFGEADRIVTLLTPDQGKIRVMAKGARKIKSKLAGGIELFSISDVTFLPGKGDIGTLISTRMLRHFDKIASDLNRTMLGYELLKRLNRATEDATGEEYYNLLEGALTALNDGLDLALLELWFDARLLHIAGHQPNLATDSNGDKLQADQRYNFDPEAMTFVFAPKGSCSAATIKLLRVVFGLQESRQLAQLQDISSVLPACRRLVTAMRQQHIA
jgi:DNA repair protein RecO